VVRRAVFLAFDGDAENARGLLARALRTFPHQRQATIAILRQALAAAPGAIEPLLLMAASMRDAAPGPQERGRLSARNEKSPREAGFFAGR
jgi:hypothetical protein